MSSKGNGYTAEITTLLCFHGLRWYFALSVLGITGRLGVGGSNPLAPTILGKHIKRIPEQPFWRRPPVAKSLPIPFADFEPQLTDRRSREAAAQQLPFRTPVGLGGSGGWIDIDFGGGD